MIHQNKKVFGIILVFTTLTVFILMLLSSIAKAAISPIIGSSTISNPEGINPQVFKLATKAYTHAREMGIDKQGILTVIDYSLPSSDRRLWVIDMNNHKILYNVHVAHGRDSGMNYATKFSDQPRSLESCIGVIETGDTYSGEHGYSLRLKGLEQGVNDKMYNRSIVMHSAWYVSQSFLDQYGRLGRSWGCPALSTDSYKPIINEIKEGTIIFAYYPDQHWLHTSKFLA